MAKDILDKVGEAAIEDRWFDHGKLLGLEDDDHLQYWRVGDEYSRNYGSSIGDDQARMAIDLEQKLLVGEWAAGLFFVEESVTARGYFVHDAQNIYEGYTVEVGVGGKTLSFKGGILTSVQTSEE